MTHASASMGRGGGVRTGSARAGITTAPGNFDHARHSARRALNTLDWIPGRRRWLAALAWLLIAAVLFVCYLHVSRTQPVNSDGAANALQAWDMLHGNLLLHNWWLSDVSFYTTELPEYMAVEAVRGLNADVVHVAAALTYTLLVLLAALLAKGRATGGEAVARMLLAGGILAAPALGTAAGILLLSPDHVGTNVPVLLIWLVLDRAARRWWVAVVTGALMTWALMGDGIVMYTGFLPLTIVCAIRTYRAIVVRREPGTGHRYELGLILAALVAAELSTRLLVLIHAVGGFEVWPVSPLLAVSSQMPRHFAFTAHGLFVLFGADFFGRKVSFATMLLLLHLAGLALAGWAACAGVRRFFRDCDLVDQVLVAGVVIGLTVYVLGQRVSDINSTREFAEVLPFAAVLAGRLLAPRLINARLAPALAVVLAGYLLSLGQAAAAAPVPPMNQQLATWLAAHHLRYGMSTYWQSSVVSLTTGERIMVVPVATATKAPGSLVRRDEWESTEDWYDPGRHDANFIVQLVKPNGLPAFLPLASVANTFGKPARVYLFGPYRILVFHQNLLTELG
jgi:hypothetical protein